MAVEARFAAGVVVEVFLFQPFEAQLLFGPGLADLAFQQGALKAFLCRLGMGGGQNACFTPGIDTEQIGLIAEHLPLQLHRFDTSLAESGQRSGQIRIQRLGV